MTVSVSKVLDTIDTATTKDIQALYDNECVSREIPCR